jgi:hypothetical protein
MFSRRHHERTLRSPPDDGYGVECIEGMIADIRTQYAAMMQEEEVVFHE